MTKVKAEETETDGEQSYEEGYDRELLGIFIGQLKENISFLRSQLEQPDAADNKHEVLERCADCIESLKSSANYMDYQKLVLMYKNWLARVDGAKDKLSKGNDVSFDFMKAYFDKVVKIFPQTDESELEMDGEISVEKQEKDLTFNAQTLPGGQDLPGLAESDALLLEEEALPSIEESNALLLEDEVLTSIEKPDAVPGASDLISRPR